MDEQRLAELVGDFMARRVARAQSRREPDDGPGALLVGFEDKLARKWLREYGQLPPTLRNRPRATPW